MVCTNFNDLFTSKTLCHSILTIQTYSPIALSSFGKILQLPPFPLYNQVCFYYNFSILRDYQKVRNEQIFIGNRN